MKVEINFNPVKGRRCDGCTLCCDLLPVSEFGKGKNVLCQHARLHVGCAIYHMRPRSCREWTCRWITDERLGDDLRPSKTHVVFDQMPDVILGWPSGESGVGEPAEIVCIQVWVDPEHPNAFREPAVRAAISKFADEGLPAIIRIGEHGLVVMAAGGKWHEIDSDCRPEEDFADVRARRVGWVPRHD